MPHYTYFRFEGVPVDTRLFRYDDGGPECFPTVEYWSTPYTFGQGHWHPLDDDGFFHGVRTFRPGVWLEYGCADCDTPFEARDVGFLFDTGEVCERCARAVFVDPGQEEGAYR